MANNIVNIVTHDTAIKPKDKITETLSKYIEKTINEDKSVTYIEISTTYFLENDKNNPKIREEIKKYIKKD